MKAARVVVLGVALAAGGAAAFLVGSEATKSETTPASVIKKLPTAEVPVTRADIGMGLVLGSLSLALRSLLDAGKTEEERDPRRTEIAAARYGVISNT